jgi:hypothetical protein
MSGEGLVELARRYVAVSDELAVIRGEIRKAVLNGGAGEEPQIPFTRPARVSGGVQRPAKEAEGAIVELLKEQPWLGTSAIAKALGAKVVTTQDRLRRLKKRAKCRAGAATVGPRPLSDG